MSSRKNKELCYDRAIKTIQAHNNAPIEKLNMLYKTENATKTAIQNYKNLESTLKDKSKIFWIDSMTLDSLVNFPTSFNNLENFDYKMPFPQIFFEFENPLKYKFLENRDKLGTELGGMLFDYKKEMNGDNNLIITAFMDKEASDIIHMNYSHGGSLVITEFIPGETIEQGPFLTNQRIYTYNPKNNMFFKMSMDPETNKLKGDPIDLSFPDDDYLDALKIINLGVNTIKYVNAKNVGFREVKRTGKRKVTKIIREGGKRGRIKKRKQKTLEVKLKPYYWVEIEKKVKQVRKIDKDEPDPDWTLNCRFWVRGHSREYLDEDGRLKYNLWIEPFVKGPEKAPWKNNRYEVLYKRFKPLLENPELRGGPWAMSDLNKELKRIKQGDKNEKQ